MDKQLTHLGVLVGVRTKSFFIQASCHSRPIRHALGRFPYLTVEEARKRGMAVLSKIFDGENPNATRRTKQELSKFTLADALDAYVKTHNGMKERTVRDYRGTLTRYFRDWLNKPLVWITPEMVLRRHAQLGQTISGSTANGAMRVLRAIYNFSRAVHPKLPENPVALYDPDLDPTLLNHATVWFITVAFIGFLLFEWVQYIRYRYCAFGERATLYYTAWMMYYIPLCGVAHLAGLQSLHRYGMVSVFLLALIAASLLKRSHKKNVWYYMGLFIFFLLGNVFFLIQYAMLQRFSHGLWVA